MAARSARRVVTLNGPEGGLSPDEEQAARRANFLPTSLGPRVLRADTAPLAALALLGGLTLPG
jgi:16S rRNA (uracil1498-N3)-methyltransferase